MTGRPFYASRDELAAYLESHAAQRNWEAGQADFWTLIAEAVWTFPGAVITTVADMDDLKVRAHVLRAFAHEHAGPGEPPALLAGLIRQCAVLIAESVPPLTQP